MSNQAAEIIPIIETFYDDRLKDWDSAINQALKGKGFKSGQAMVICAPNILKPKEKNRG